MTLVRRIGLILPVLRKGQVCEACREQFACEISLGGCWCGEIRLSENTRRELRAKYRSCLCRACLEKAEARDAASENQPEVWR